MNARTQIVLSLLAAGTLLGAGASGATDIAELPLKAAVLSKPNVVFGIDDSGSMDAEVMLTTNDGAFWWDFNAKTGWDASGVAHYNAAGTASAQFRKYPYLFPNGTGTGERTYGDDANDHFAVPATRQFAFLRSSSYNPIYYNPLVAYTPWSPAYVGSALKSFANAPTSAAPSHPNAGSTTFDLSATRALSTDANTTFMAAPGMLIPAGSNSCVHPSCGTWSNEAADRVEATSLRRVAMAYYPATYYVRQACAVDNLTCVSAPDGATLQRYEIRAGNSFPSGRSYAEELQNFANWFTYYRKRKLMLSAASGQVLERLSGMRLGAVRFNSLATPTMYDADAAAAASNRLRVAGFIYEAGSGGGTPTRETLKYIGEYYRSSSAIQYACQRNNAFIFTDGFAQASSVSVPSYSASTWGSSAPYQTTHSGSLADLALAYYTINLKPGLTAGSVPASPTDTNTNLHLNTYALTLGARGTIYAGDATALPTTAGAWPAPNVDRSPTSVDDLWHATINGRGKMFMATNPTETADAIQRGLTDMLSAVGAQGGVAVTSINLLRSDSSAYLGTYNPAGWTGDLSAAPVDTGTGQIGTTRQWSAATLLNARDWTTRIIASQIGGSGVAFTAAAVGAFVNPGNTWGSSSDVINYLRGERVNEGAAFRQRHSLIGAVISAEAAIDRDAGVAYLASGEGMLHAVDIRNDKGRELWAFVPEAVLPDIGATTARSYSFRTQLDGTPVVRKLANGSKLLVAGMGAAGRSYYALDVTSPRGLSEAQLAAKVKWAFPSDATTQAKVGQTLGKPVIVRVGNTDHVLVTSGYNNADGRGRLWMLNPATGSVVQEFDTGAGTAAAEAGLAHVSPFVELDGTVRYAFGGDLLGNVWRFDLVDRGAPVKVAVLKSSGGALQPVTTAPELAYIDGKRIILLGTGRLLHQNDFGGSAQNTFYAIADGTTLANARSSLVQKQFVNATTVSGADVNWATGRGWYMDLPNTAEHVNTRPTLARGVVSFVTNTAGSTDCSASSRLYALDLRTGARSDNTDFVQSVISTVAGSSGANLMLTVGVNPPPCTGTNCQNPTTGCQRIVAAGQTSNGQSWQRDLQRCTSVQPKRTAWREIRRD